MERSGPCTGTGTGPSARLREDSPGAEYRYSITVCLTAEAIARHGRVCQGLWPGRAAQGRNMLPVCYTGPIWLAGLDDASMMKKKKKKKETKVFRKLLLLVCSVLCSLLLSSSSLPLFPKTQDPLVPFCPKLSPSCSGLQSSYEYQIRPKLTP